MPDQDYPLFRPQEALLRAPELVDDQARVAANRITSMARPDPLSGRVRSGVVTAFSAALWTATVQVGGSSTAVPGIPVLRGVRPMAGDTVQLLQVGPEMTVTGVLYRPVGWHAVGAGGGEPAFTTGWGNLSGSLRFRLDTAANCHIQGRVSRTSGALNSVFTLPADYRPTQDLDYGLKCNADAGSMAWVRVGAAGVIDILGNTGLAAVRLDLNVVFSTL
jgi:hypothetical protein